MKADTTIPAWSLIGWRQESQTYNSSPKAVVEPGRSRVVDEVQRLSTGEFVLAQGRPILPFYLGLHLIRWGSPTKWSATCFTHKFSDLNVNLLRSTLTDTSRTMLTSIWGFHIPEKLTHKINCHKHITSFPITFNIKILYISNLLHISHVFLPSKMKNKRGNTSDKAKLPSH